MSKTVFEKAIRLARRASMVLGLAVMLALTLVTGAATAHPGQHGPNDGHLPPVQRGVSLIGKLDLFKDQEQPGRIADVAAFGNYAYLGAFASPNCENGGVYVIDVSNPSSPQEERFIPTSDPSSFVGEGLQVLDMKTQYFQGQVLIYNNETCAPFGGPVLGEDPRLGFGGPGGASLVDVTDPKNPRQLADHVGDTDPPEAGQLPSGVPHNTHSAFGWQQGDKAYMVIVDNGEFGTTDIDIWDITDPRSPQFVLETGMANFPKQDCNPEGADDTCLSVVQENPPPNGNEPMIHDFMVNKFGDRYLFLGSYWDGGYIILDFTNLGDTSLPENERAKFLRDTNFGAEEPLSDQLGLPPGVTPEGNAHQAEFNRDGTLFLGADEDFDPFRGLGTITSGRYTDHSFSGTAEESPMRPIDPETGLTGPTKFIGKGCVPAQPAPTSDTIALIERGTCQLALKVQNAEAAGYAAAVIFQDATTNKPDCEQRFHVPTVGIPSLYVGRLAGLKLLNVENIAANSCDTATPDLGTPSEALSWKDVFDGWGYLHLYDANTMQAIDHWALPEALDPTKARGYGDLSIHEVATDPDHNIAYISHYSGGFRVVEFGPSGIREVGAFIDEGGNNFWGVQVHRLPGSNETLVLASDRDAGLYIFEGVAPDPPPQLNAPSDQEATEDQEQYFDLGYFADPGTGSPWQVSVDWGDGSPAETFEASPDSPLSRPHTYAENGTHTVTVTVTEGDEDPSSDTGTFTVTVKPANDAPQAEDDSYSVDEDQTLTADASRGVLANDTDPDNDALKAVVVDQPTRGTLDLKEDGSFTYTPEKDYNGSDSFTYKASDGAAQSNTATVSITVNATNDPPVANNDPPTGVIYKAKVGQTLNVPVVRGLLANDTDPDNDALVVSDADSSTPSVLDPVTRPTQGRLALKPDGSFAYEPRSNARGKDTFTYMVSDGNGGTDTAKVSIKIVR